MNSFYSNMKLSHRMIAPNFIFLFVLGLAVYIAIHSNGMVNNALFKQNQSSELQTHLRTATMNIQKFTTGAISFEQLEELNGDLLRTLSDQKVFNVFVSQMRESLDQFENLNLKNAAIENEILKLSEYSLEQSNGYINAVSARLADNALEDKVSQMERKVISGALKNSIYQYTIQLHLEKIKHQVEKKEAVFNYISRLLSNVARDVKDLNGTPFESLPVNAQNAVIKIESLFQNLVVNLENQNRLKEIVQKDINEILFLIDKINSDQNHSLFDRFEQYFSMIAWIIMIAVVLAIAFNIFTASRITRPIAELAEVLEKYGKGDMDVRAHVKSQDEIGFFAAKFNSLLDQIHESATRLKKSESKFRSLFSNLQTAINTRKYSFRFNPESDGGSLAESLNKMLFTLEESEAASVRQDWFKTGQADLNNLISGERNLSVICQKAITFIAKYVGAQVGTFFVREPETEEFSLAASYAFKERKGFVNRLKPGEGLAGQAALEKEMIVFSEVPQDYLKIESSLGYVSPKTIVALPLVFEDDVKGVIELGMLEKLLEHQSQFMESAGESLAVGLNAAMFNEKLENILTFTKQQSNELKEQQEELKEQQEELKTTNEELEKQTVILKDSEAKLQLQQEELQASNEELEEKTEILETQKTEIEKKNTALVKKQTEVEEKARQLELATRYKSEFLANMSHELRTPLNSLLILANMLAENGEENLSSDQVDSAKSIQRSGQNLLRLINDILDLSKIEANKIELSISNVSLESLQSNCKTEFSHMAKEKGLSFNIDIQEKLPRAITTDELRLNQIIRNLVGNAIKFTDKGEISVLFSRPSEDTDFETDSLNNNSALAISVSDTGPGIPEDKLRMIFKAFKQVDGSISRRHGGTGLGLSISRELSALIGGELSVKSTKGDGTVFTLFIPEVLSPTSNKTKANHFPINTENPASSDIKIADLEDKDITPLVKEASGHSKTILIIEDDKEFATILADFFEKDGYKSIIAPDGETGIKFVIEHLPTAIILDIGLPGIDGWAVLSELKNNPATRHIPVHIMSAYDETRQGLEKGAAGYLTKPVDPQGMRDALSRINTILSSKVKELLIIEDDKELQSTILKLMKTNDIHSEAVDSGKKALELMKHRKFDCMILDIGLPDISGFELLDTINSHPEIEKIPVIIYTGRNLSREEAEKLEMYSSSIVLKNASSMERLLDETALFMHRVENDMPKAHQKMIQTIRDNESILPGKSVLLVDDDMRNAFALNKFLKSRGMDVTIAKNGQKALDVLEENKTPDIVLMDIMMPVMDGYETIRRIRKQKKFKNLPVLALTAKAMGTDREECIRCGANDYLSKPVDTSKLLTMLRVWLYS